MSLSPGARPGPYEVLAGPADSNRCMLIHIARWMVRTNIVLDDDLVAEAFRHSAAKTKKGLVHEALRELIRVRRRKSLQDLRGKIRFAEGYDHKALRTAR